MKRRSSNEYAMTMPIQITHEVWASGHVIAGFKMPPVAQFWRGAFVSCDRTAGVWRVRFPTNTNAIPGGMATPTTASYVMR
jgi:hypothetical protein